MSTVRANQILDAAGGNTARINGMTPTAQSLQGFRNRIINGNMVIDQRNAGASVTITADPQYTVDRWKIGASQASRLSVQRSTLSPEGFSNSALITSLAATTVGASDYFGFQQDIEGFNMSDLSWGTASAQPITISFRVRSSLTGTFAGSIRNLLQNRSYPFTFTINAANTWEAKTVVVAGDTSGSWNTDNTVGLRLTFSLGVGSSFTGTAGAWASSNLINATGAVNMVATNGATFVVTGVQLEAGSVATPFEQIDYGRELMMCQRYFAKSYNQAIALATPGDFAGAPGRFVDATSNYASVQVFFPVRMRATPTVTIYNPSTGATASLRSDAASHPAGVTQQGESGCWFFANDSTITTSFSCRAHYGASAEL
jgi:hypothetical protein